VDDSYILVKAPMADMQDELRTIVTQHLQYLNAMGMLRNLSKTEAVVFSKVAKSELTISIGTFIIFII